MHKSISMSLNGTSYPVEDAAYDRLDRYLSKVRRSFVDPAEAEEVASDIEARMAERLTEHVPPGSVVTLEHAELLIAAIGDPALVDDDGAPDAAGSSHDPSERPKLWRTPDNKMIAGVCGGLAAYFSVDVVWLRLAFVLAATLGLTVAGPLSAFAYLSLVAFVGYAGLWLLLPMASTSAVAAAGGPATAGTAPIASFTRQLGANDSLRTIPSAIARTGRERASAGRETASHVARSARGPLAAFLGAVALVLTVGWSAGMLAVTAAWRFAAGVIGVAMAAVALVGIAIVIVAGISLVADDVPTFIGFYADHVAPFRAENAVTFVAMSVAGFAISAVVLASVLAFGVRLVRRR